MRAVAEEAVVPDRWRPVRRLGVDETVSRRHRRFVTHLVDLDDGTVIVTVEGRSAKVLLDALEAQGSDWLAGVQEVAIDPFTPYAKAVRQLVPHARLVVDKFHILRLFGRAVDQVRRRTRDAVHPGWFPMLLFGILGLVSIPFTRIGEGAGIGLFWLVAGPVGGFATARHYRNRALSLGVGMRGRAYMAVGVVLFVTAWVAGLLTESAAGPMIAVALGYIGFARLDRNWPIAVVASALGVAAVLVAVVDPAHGDVILALAFGLAFTLTGLLLRRRDPIA